MLMYRPEMTTLYFFCEHPGSWIYISALMTPKITPLDQIASMNSRPHPAAFSPLPLGCLINTLFLPLKLNTFKS